MRAKLLIILAGILARTTPVWAEDLVYVMGNPALSRGLELVVDPGPPIRATDYFRRAALSFRVGPGFPRSAERAYLLIEYLDQGIGCMQVTFDSARQARSSSPEDDPAYTQPSDQAGFTTLDTGKVRHAVFRLDKPGFQHRQRGGADIRIEGLHVLRRLQLSASLPSGEWERARSEIPVMVTPRLTLSRPVQLVLSVGADTQTRSDLARGLANMNELCPMARLLGFTGIESYVKWNFVELEKAQFDWSYYDAVVSAARRFGLRWFPLLIVGSAYALPEWFHDSPLNEGFVCLEHRLRNDIQTIYSENQTPFVQNFLKAFGAHYEPMDVLLGVRLGPSGNYGESQYPAGGNWGYKWQKQHIHIGWWAGDRSAPPHFRRFLRGKYPSVDALNRAWDENYRSFDDVEPFVAQFAETKRKRKDMVDWYMGAMTDWCERWALWARDAMPNTEIYQSAGGWGFVESGTDFTDQTRSMARTRGGIRATNETDSYAQNFYATRMMSSAARFYRVAFGTEPASFGSARGVAARIFNILVNDGQHLFFYFPNLLHNDQAVDKWLELAPLLDRREKPFVEVAALYPDTKSKLDDGVFRHLHAFAFNARVAALRPHLDFDFCSEQMVRDGALAAYKALLFLWSDVVESDVLDAIDRWVRDGGTVVYPYWNRMPLGTVEDDYAVYNRWLRSETGRGRVIFYRGDREPPERYASFIQSELARMKGLDARTKRMLSVRKPSEVYVSVLESGTLAILNYRNDATRVEIPGMAPLTIDPYSIRLVGNWGRLPILGQSAFASSVSSAQNREASPVSISTSGR